MYIAARHYTGRPLAAFVAALIYAFAPYRLAQIDHIHVVAGEWIPLAFLFLDLSLQHSRWRHWILFALFYLLQLLSSIYYGIFLTYTLLAYVLIRYSWPFVKQVRQKRWAYIKQLLIQSIKPLVVFFTASIPLFILMRPYLESLNSGFARSTFEAVGYSAFVRDFRFTAIFNWLHGIPSYNGVVIFPDGEHFLFLGWTVMALTVFGVALAFWRKNATMRAFAWTGLIVLLFAFGPNLQYSTPSGAPLLPTQSYSQPFPPNIPMPWLLAYYVLPGFQGPARSRSPRWCIINDARSPIRKRDSLAARKFTCQDTTGAQPLEALFFSYTRNTVLTGSDPMRHFVGRSSGLFTSHPCSDRKLYPRCLPMACRS